MTCCKVSTAFWLQHGHSPCAILSPYISCLTPRVVLLGASLWYVGSVSAHARTLNRKEGCALRAMCSRSVGDDAS